MIKTILRRLSPLLIIAVFAAAAILLVSTKEAPEQKDEVISVPIINVQTVTPQTLSLNLPSYGVVNPKYKTQLVTEVQGRLLSISANFVAGGVAKKGEQLAIIEPSDYEADLMQAEATLAQATAALNEEKARGEVAKIEFKDFGNGLPPELGLRIPQLKKEQANVKYAEAALARAQRNLARTVIRAPFDGIIKARNVDLGQYVTLGTNLGELYDTSIAEIRLPLANEDLAYLESVDNPETAVTLTALLAGKQVTWQGEIVRSENVIDEQTRMVYLVAEIHDPYLRNHKTEGQLPLKYGSFVNAVITGRTVNDVVMLPRHVVRNGQVAVVSADNIIEIRPVNIIRSDVDNIYIQGSFKANERVSTTSINSLNAGQKIKVLGEESKITPVDTDVQVAPTAGE
ncbi:MULTISPECIES: efflux RND transporter periplasmic adaptor subunit [Shewanella]|uniref:efflux RND transporter periplasmic adaptor subunit n=1 Tax=Shewanella TaxID=22 RepID=UPI000C5EA9B9|nr:MULTISPECIES: efflux RND transporter periplasmic adaptor subunit [Shewanella]NCQ45511.1 efflux RND transporter periplasmic adaptor subunit [Shewanella frigidimarina]MBB1320792.1 efflux RND transporter periplasmic adaptor subunit [Shewanella sp. SR43-8]MBB1389454.1 efflux RND transporter periplasmic adaptor subunit [Shewanella sp. SG44-6]NCO71570.1 efflux RND transporter periplasmic adaptor subunit [Shewanella vesiculosa]NCP36618.1 efflux RND transporter periplasmic adaptor subunit [Shewanel